ncbi:MAG TPA: hypothetical protein VJG90_02290 [Candidatus Nanoarchaeia archaeon]|nr:hypothetical protein [Candidatus Nanoarchaeia archaeon]
MQLSVKEVDEQVFREFKAESVREGLKVGKALTWAMQFWLESREKKPKLSILDFKPRSWGKGTEHVSEEIDEILYNEHSN